MSELLKDAESAAAAATHGALGAVTAISSGGLSAVSWQVRAVIYGLCVLAVGLAISHIYNMGYDAADNAWKVKMAAADDKFRKDQKALQDKFDQRAADETAASLAQASVLIDKARRLTQPKGTIQGAPTTKLPADCVFDQARITWANAE